jgi:hypothetical protein
MLVFLYPTPDAKPAISPSLVPLDLWVSKWVDYSEKYGLGYLLSNGACGVYFNDSSRIILSPDSMYEFVERWSVTVSVQSVHVFFCVMRTAGVDLVCSQTQLAWVEWVFMRWLLLGCQNVRIPRQTTIAWFTGPTHGSILPGRFSN